MCGRYAASRDAAALVEVLTGLGIEVTVPAAPDAGDSAALPGGSWNVAPTDPSLVVAAAKEPAGGLRLAPLSWGLVPSWAKDRRGAARMINARVETVTERSAYRSLVASRRCLVPIDGWYEWRTSAGPKQPFHVSHGSDPVLLLAGLYSWWREPRAGQGPDAEAGPWFGSFTVLTGPARGDLAWLHDRMPLPVPPALRHDWLGTGGREPQDLLADLRVASADPQAMPLRWHAVDRRVGNVREDGSDLVRPVAVPSA